MYSGRKTPDRRRRLQEDTRRIAQEGAGSGTLVSVYSEGIRRHGTWAPLQRARADGARRKLSRRAVDEYTRTRRRNDDDAARTRHAASEREVPETAAEWR